VRWLYTGHSLGALLAEAVAAVRGARALTFAAPAVASVLRNRTAKDPGGVAPWGVAALYNEWDPLRYEAKGELPGASCIWSTGRAPPGCRECDLSGKKMDLQIPACRTCFMETHVYAHYFRLVETRQRPMCAPAAGPDILF